MLIPVRPSRDCQGFWTHPDLPDVEMLDSDFVRYCFNLGYFLRILKLSDSKTLLDIGDGKQVRGINCSNWDPVAPPASFLLSIRDSYCGPIAVFAIPR